MGWRGSENVGSGWISYVMKFGGSFVKLKNWWSILILCLKLESMSRRSWRFVL